MPVQPRLTATQIKRMGRGAPFYPGKRLGGAVGRKAWTWERDDALHKRAAQRVQIAENFHVSLLTNEARKRFEQTGDIAEADNAFRIDVTNAQKRQSRALFDEAKVASRRWASERRQFERSIGLTRRKNRSGALSIGVVEGMGELIRNLKESDPELFKGWKKDMGDVITKSVVPTARRYAPVSRAINEYLAGRGRSRLTKKQAALRRAYVYPDDRAAPGSGTRPEYPAGNLRKSVRKRVTTRAVGITVGGTKRVVYAPPTIWGWDVRNRKPNNFLWAAIQSTLEEVTDELLEVAGERAEEFNVSLNYKQRKRPAEWIASDNA